MADLTWKICLSYLNNVIIYGKTFVKKDSKLMEDTLPRWSRSIYEIIKNASLQKKVRYLEYIVAETGIKIKV